MMSIMDSCNVIAMLFSGKMVFCLNLGTIDENSMYDCIRDVQFFSLQEIPFQLIKELVSNTNNLFFFDFEGKGNKLSRYSIKNEAVIPTLLFNPDLDLWVLTAQHSDSNLKFISLEEFTIPQIKKLVEDERNFFFCLPE